MNPLRTEERDRLVLEMFQEHGLWAVDDSGNVTTLVQPKEDAKRKLQEALARIPTVTPLDRKEAERRKAKHALTMRIKSGTLQGDEIAKAKAEYKQTYGEEF